MKILFIKSVVNTPYFTFDIGLGFLTAVLKKNKHQTDLHIVKSMKDLKKLDHRIELIKPDFISFSTYASSFDSSVKISNHLKKKFPHIYQLMGGVHLILNPNDIEKAKSIDAVCIGEGEEALIDFIKRWEKNDGSHIKTPGFYVRDNEKIVKNPKVGMVHNIDKLPFPDRDLFTSQYVQPAILEGTNSLEFLFTRGCPFLCSYCSNHALRKALMVDKKTAYVRGMSPEKAIEWIKRDIKKYSAESLLFHDDTFTADKKWLFEFLKIYQKKIKIPFGCNVRADTLDEKTVKKLKRAGCFVFMIGVETGDNELRRMVLKRAMKNEVIKEAFRLSHKYKIAPYAFVMIGLPDETPKKCINTIKFVADLKAKYTALSIFFPYPGTNLHEICIQKKYLKKKKISLDFVERADTILKMPNFQRKDILYFYNYFDELITLYQNRSKKFINMSSIRFKLLSIWPSHPLFLPTHLLYLIITSIKHFESMSKNLKRTKSYLTLSKDSPIPIELYRE